MFKPTMASARHQPGSAVSLDRILFSAMPIKLDQGKSRLIKLNQGKSKSFLPGSEASGPFALQTTFR
jgi:hypothetical protein